MDIFEIVITYRPVLIARELMASGLVIATAMLGAVYLYRGKTGIMMTI